MPIGVERNRVGKSSVSITGPAPATMAIRMPAMIEVASSDANPGSLFIQTNNG